MKKYLLISIILLLTGYLFFSVFYFGDSHQNDICTDFEVVIKDSTKNKFIQSNDIIDLLKREKIYPVGKPMSEVNTVEILDTILNNKLVKSAKVYTAQKGKVIANIYQRQPIFRVISETKGNFYIDENREKMPISYSSTVYVPLATGLIDEDFAKNELYDFVIYLLDNPYWNAWIEQIVVKPNKDVYLIPKIGDFHLNFGKLENYDEKFSNFTLFIENGLSVTGWNRYSEISLKYDNQIVCTKK